MSSGYVLLQLKYKSASLLDKVKASEWERTQKEMAQIPEYADLYFAGFSINIVDLEENLKVIPKPTPEQLELATSEGALTKVVDAYRKAMITRRSRQASEKAPTGLQVSVVKGV